MEAAKRFRDGEGGDFQRWRQRRVSEMEAESFRDGGGGEFQRWRRRRFSEMEAVESFRDGGGKEFLAPAEGGGGRRPKFGEDEVDFDLVLLICILTSSFKL